MRKISIALVLLVGLLFSGCIAGPHQLRRTVDDWDNKMYVESPWLDAVLWIVPVIPLADFGAFIADFFVTDAYTFWLEDAFGGEGGTGYINYDAGASRNMKSLLSDDGKFLEITGGGS